MLNLDLLGDDASTRFDVITSIVSAVEFVCTRNGASTYESMEQWAARHTESHARSLARLERRRDGLLAVRSF